MATDSKHPDFRLFFITNSHELAEFVSSKGVDRLFVDLEWNGKNERQKNRSTVVSGHTMSDVAVVRAAAPNTELMVRLNPLYSGSGREIRGAIDLGADVLMLPMYRSIDEVKKFCELVGRKSRVCLLAETIDAIECIEETVKIDGVDEVHIGLNDLHIDLKQTFMFQPLASGFLNEATRILRASGKPFGIGGIARIGEGEIPAEQVLGEHVWHGSTAAILSRTFHRNISDCGELQARMDFESEINSIKSKYSEWLNSTSHDIEQAHIDFGKNVERVIGLML